MKTSSVLVRSVTKTYRRGHRRVTALQDVSFEISQGELALLVGPSGSGKTTVLNLIAALDRPDSGRNHCWRIRDHRSVALRSLTTSLVSRHASVEAHLMLGATRREAAAPVTREALRSALMPTINSMAVTGVVSLPGMMTGQILGGVPPAEAVKYQILVMFLIAGGTGLGAVTAVLGGVYRLTDGRRRLRLDRLRPPKPA